MTDNEQLLDPNLLLVDDDEIFCRVLAKAIQKRGFNVIIAHDLQQAMQLADEQHPEFALVDLRIGQDSGLSVIKSLVESEQDIRIVVLTGYASISTAVESIKLGAVHYLTKPAEVDDILAALYHDQGNADIDLQSRPMSTRRMEWEHLQKVLSDYDGNISAAARAMGMHRRTLQRKLQKKPVKA